MNRMATPRGDTPPANAGGAPLFRTTRRVPAARARRALAPRDRTAGRAPPEGSPVWLDDDAPPPGRNPTEETAMARLLDVPLALYRQIVDELVRNGHLDAAEWQAPREEPDYVRRFLAAEGLDETSVRAAGPLPSPDDEAARRFAALAERIIDLPPLAGHPPAALPVTQRRWFGAAAAGLLALSFVLGALTVAADPRGGAADARSRGSVAAALLMEAADLVSICHVTGAGAIPIAVAEAAVPAHLAHGDALGLCGDPGDSGDDGGAEGDEGGQDSDGGDADDGNGTVDDGAVDDNVTDDAPGAERVSICHVTGAGAIPITVAAAAVPAHVAHGDALGGCGDADDGDDSGEHGDDGGDDPADGGDDPPDGGVGPGDGADDPADGGDEPGDGGDDPGDGGGPAGPPFDGFFSDPVPATPAAPAGPGGPASVVASTPAAAATPPPAAVLHAFAPGAPASAAMGYQARDDQDSQPVRPSGRAAK